MGSDSKRGTTGKTIMLVGCDRKRILQRRLEAAGARVIRFSDGAAALDCARRTPLYTAVLVSKGALIDDAEIVLNLRDLNCAMEIVILIDRVKGARKRLLQQLMEHPIEGTKVFTRRQLQKQLSTILTGRP